MNWTTLANTTGLFSLAQRLVDHGTVTKKLTIPYWYQFPPCLHTSGPPESPSHASLPAARCPAHSMLGDSDNRNMKFISEHWSQFTTGTSSCRRKLSGSTSSTQSCQPKQCCRYVSMNNPRSPLKKSRNPQKFTSVKSAVLFCYQTANNSKHQILHSYFQRSELHCKHKLISNNQCIHESQVINTAYN